MLELVSFFNKLSNLGFLLPVTAQATLVVVRRHCTRRNNSDRIGSPKYKNLKIRKERERERVLSGYI
jgi:hypothetical protein